MLRTTRLPSCAPVGLVATMIAVVLPVSPSDSLLAQERGALEVLRTLPLDSLAGTIRVYHSPGQAERAAVLQRMYEGALSFYRDTLNHPLDATLAVLTEEHWAALDGPPPYGMPWVTYRAPDPVVILPATIDRGVVKRKFGEASRASASMKSAMASSSSISIRGSYASRLCVGSMS
jgi:hypothetical protein